MVYVQESITKRGKKMGKGRALAIAIAMAVILVMVMSVVVVLAPPVMSGYGNTTDESNFAFTDTFEEEQLWNDSSKEANWSHTKPIVPFEWNVSSDELTPVIILLNTGAFVTGSDSAAGNTSFDAAKQEVSSILEADELQPMGWGTMDKLNNSRAVKAIYPDRKVHALLATSVSLIHASDAWQLQDSNGNNVTGEGVLVAVLDTGVDYMHPDLGGGFGSGYKVVGGYDIVNNDTDPMDDYGHGTHIVGIVAANGSLRGVAPDAKVLAYKVLDERGEGNVSDVIDGMGRAIEDGADILSMSFGRSDFLGSGVPLVWAIDNAIVSGVIVVVAAGNDGPGFETINSPASHEKVITVGAVGKGKFIIEVVSENKKLESYPMKFSPHTSVTGEIVYAGLGYPENFSSSNTGEIVYAGLGYPENFSSSNTSFTGKIALIKRGILTFEEKVKNAYHAGAIGAIVFNNEFGNFHGTLGNESRISAFSISQEDGKYLLDLMNRTTVVTRWNQAIVIDYDSVYYFSSLGPGPGYTIKPDIVAPGYHVNSTTRNGKYGKHAGTSIATPHVSGACALLLQLHPDWTPGMIKAALMNNAKDIGYGVFEQGAGRVDVLKAATPEFIVTPPSIGVYVMKTTSSNKKIKVENLKNYTIPVNVSVVREQGMYLNFTYININSTSFDDIKINVTPDNGFTLHPKESEQIDFTITVPENYTAGYYCGKILMKSDNHSISVPFALALKKSTLPWIFPDVFSATPSAVSNAEAGKQLDPSESFKK
jgi:minor extracellular serine protease Vpr